MSQALRIGVIGGAGWLGGAIAATLLTSGVTTPHHLSLSFRARKPERFPDAFWTADNRALVERSDIVVVSVRPADWPAVAIDCSGRLVISVMAGIRLDALARAHRSDRVVRALPNTAAEVATSYTPWIASPGVDEKDKAAVRAIFDACGTQDEVDSESDIDYLTGLTGSGPAFPALLAAAMMDDAVARGLSREVAKRAVKTLLTGTGRLVESRDEDPGEVVQTFLDYRGTTAAAIEAMRSAGLGPAIAAGLAAAFEKSVTMGQQSS